MNKRCINCPIAEGGKPCLATLDCDRFGHFCDWASENDPLKRAAIAGRAEIGIVGPSPKRVLPPAVTLDLIARMKKCEFWEKVNDCGCGANKCLAGKGRQGVVSHQNCFDCLQDSAGVDRLGEDVDDVGGNEGGVDVNRGTDHVHAAD